ncbi:flagellar motor switch protein FliM [Sneathiella chungangensis]|uniref:Flagellar motor switch protein FliM n=1 Tax=Sneathiella chungangensis TaxID=1418234 RepID=A0A845MD21_9PROT|nr:flagellar motor switch protein FliM [Sneathiella chungangensis]MZR21240.1 flagellar motor switch protein FliM [Sneathiella chungangensis]
MADLDDEMDMAAAMAAEEDGEMDMAAAMAAEGGDDEMAAAMTDADGGDTASSAAAMTGHSTRVLNQDEIDSLLGFDMDGDGGGENSGIKAIINSALVNYERLPMLEVVFDRLVRMMTTSLRNFTSDNVEVSLDNITSIRFGDYLNSIPLPAILSVFRAEEWDNFGLIMVESSLIYSIVDVLLGGRRGTAAMRIEGRPYTTIERNLVERMVSVVLNDMTGAFEPLSPVNFRHERIETNPRFATIARPANAAILIKLRIDMEDRGGRLEMLLPYATLEPVRELLLQMFMGEKFGRDSIWENHLATELWSTEVDIQAVLDEKQMSLNDVLKLEIGDTIMFNASPSSPTVLRCGGISMVSGKMGRSGQNIAVKVDKSLRTLG